MQNTSRLSFHIFAKADEEILRSDDKLSGAI